MIARYDLETKGITTQAKIDQSLYRGNTYLFDTEYNYYDFAVDENGLWLLYAHKPSNTEATLANMLVIAKLEPNYLEIERHWNITVTRKNYCNAFIAQGILYLMESCDTKNTEISYAYDLYNNREIRVSISFINVFEHNRMLSYDYLSRNIMSWDNGRLISYPILAE